MKKSDQLKNLVKDKYRDIVLDKPTGCCCGRKDKVDYTVFSEDYQNIEGYEKDADLGLGCGIPTQFAGIDSGDKVLDLGSGAGNDVFVARSIVGEKGHVTGLDFTPNMIEKARENRKKTGFTNVEFVLGDIETMPFPDQHFDVILSNCVLNLVPDKSRAFREIHRCLKDGGRFCVSDMVLIGELPDKIRNAGAMYAGCVSGALPRSAYLSIIEEQGFRNIIVHKEREIILPDDLLQEFLSGMEIMDFRETGAGIYSITVTAEK